MNNPYQQENGLPIIGKENEYYEWEKEQALKEFKLLSIEQQEEIRETNKRFQKKTL